MVLCFVKEFLRDCGVVVGCFDFCYVVDEVDDNVDLVWFGDVVLMVISSVYMVVFQEVFVIDLGVMMDCLYLMSGLVGLQWCW